MANQYVAGSKLLGAGLATIGSCGSRYGCRCSVWFVNSGYF